MSDYPGVLSVGGAYLRDALWAPVSLLWPMVLVCLPAAAFYGWVGAEFLPFALLSFGGLLVYLGQLSIADRITDVTEAGDSRETAILATALTVVYYNVVLLVGALLAGALYMSGFPAMAFGVAVLYPAYDAEMVGLGAPVSVAGAFVFSVAAVAAAVLAVEQFAGWERWREGLRAFRDLLTSKDGPERTIGFGDATLRRRVRSG